MKTPCAMCATTGQVYMRTDLSNPDCDNEDLTTCPRCGGSGFLEIEGVRLLVLWASLIPTLGPHAQFVAAFTEGEVECWPESYERRRTEVEQWFRDFGRRPGETIVHEFFTTWEEIARPAPVLAGATEGGEPNG